MLANRIEAEIGRRVHLLVGLCLIHEIRDPEGVTRALFRSQPAGGTVLYSARAACIDAVRTYLRRCVPIGWTLVGVEEPVGRGRADLLWVRRNPFRIFIDELKTNTADPHEDAELRAQLLRLCIGGNERWRESFAGVRTVPLASPRRAWLTTCEPGSTVLRFDALPPELAVR